jgi:outer membrane usher protein
MDKQKNQDYLSFKYFICISLLIFGLCTSLTVKAQPEKPVAEKKLKTTDVAELIPLLLEIKLNGYVLPGVVQCYKDALGRIWVNANDLSEWHIALPTYAPLIYQQEKLYPLNDVPELHYTLDQYTMQLSMQAPARIFTNQLFEPYSKRLGALRPSDPGAFVNYDAVALRNNNPSINQTNLSALLGLGLFNRWGVGTADLLAYNKYANNFTLLNTSSSKLLRLNTTWTLDEPEKIATWRFGDAVTGSTHWSSAARFAGIQYATNFNTQPNLITFPLPGYQGEATIPSTVDVFVNSALNQEQIVNNGPYTFNNIPVITGTGTVKVVTQDLLGRTQTISFPYYASPLLLKPNLVNFSYEAGFIRDNYGVNNNDYGRPMGVATYQRGITNHLTLGGHAEVLLDQQTLGFSADYLIKQFGVASLAVAGGHNSLGTGGLLGFGFSRQSSPLSYGFNSLVTTNSYLQLGDQPNISSSPSLTTQLFLGYGLPDYGSLSMSYTLINSRNFNMANGISSTPTARLLTATYGRSLFKNISLTLGFSGDLRNSQTNQAFLTLLLSPDSTHIVSNGTSWQNHQLQDVLQLTKPTPLGIGYGYDVMASNNSNRYAGADFTLHNSIGSYTARVAKGSGNENYELDASGSAIYFAGDGFLARKLSNSFVLVQTPHYAGIDVLYQNQLMGHTNRKGNLLITELLPYQENVLAIDPKTLPLDATATITTKTVVPYFYSGVVARFPITHQQGLVIHLLAPNGAVVPVGAEVILQDDATQTPYVVGYEGELYLPEVSTHTIHGLVSWDEKNYRFALHVPETTEAIIELGNILCY